MAEFGSAGQGTSPLKHVHIDPVGGIAGDMFAAALIDAFPEHAVAAIGAAQTVAGVPCRASPHRDGILTGTRFIVDERADVPKAHEHSSADHHHHHHHDHDHEHLSAGRYHAHTNWRDIRARIEAAALSRGVVDHAIGIFAHLAAAEARVHGIEVEAVTFHEVGSADSIADIVAAASLIDALGRVTWSVAPLPLGSGRVRTQHGVMHVPAPATALLLEGFSVVDDGIAGERVTPTGAAILRHLACVPRSGLTGRMSRTGTGFGTRRLPGMSNVVRVLAFDEASVQPASGGTHRELAVIAFEVDDQSPEDLAAGLDRLRSVVGVHDVLQMPALGKKGRMAAHVQVLAHPDALDGAIEACFRETTTIGLRTHVVAGRALPREIRDVVVDGANVRVKVVERPGGRTAKAEADDVLLPASHAARARLRRRAERITEGAGDA